MVVAINISIINFFKEKYYYKTQENVVMRKYPLKPQGILMLTMQ